MDSEYNSLCCGCLSTDRKMLPIEDVSKKQCFFAIISELQSTQIEEQMLWLCWECEALVNRISRFRQQLSITYCSFKNYLKENINFKKIQSRTRLREHNLPSFTIVPSSIEDPESLLDDIKIENTKPIQPDLEVKEETFNGTYSDHNSDDDPLIDVKSNTNINRTSKKRKRKELRIYKELELSQQEIEEERRLLALNEDYVNAMFRCERCIESFPNEDDMKDHIKNKHEMYLSNLKCKICECSFSTEISFSYHTNKHTRRFQCVACQLRFATKRSVTKHYRSVHWASVEYDVIQKREQNGRSDAADDSDSTKQQMETFPCEFCEKTFRWKTSLRKHVETHRIQSGQKRKPYCEPCRLSFTTSSNLRKHVKTSSKHQIQLKLRKLKESGRDGSNPEKEQLSIEQIKWSVNKSREQYACQQCDKRFQWRGNLLRHLHSHEARANGELVCEPCNRTFSSVATYKQHLKISKKHVSENEFKYMCNDCGKRFANKTRLKDHIDWEHLKNYVHTCPVCEKVFKSHTSLYLHKQVVHKKGETEHLCDHCGKSFPNHAKLRSHMRALHSPESAYKCQSCSARFSWHSCLSRHVRRVHKTTGSTTNSAAV